jgi:peptide/nickel transport system substrate-binding protein
MSHPLRWQVGIGLSGSLLLLALLWSLAVATASSAPALRERVYAEGVVGTPRNLNPLPWEPSRADSEADLAALLFEGLTRLGPDGTPLPALAEHWEIDATGTVYTFTLRVGLRWHDAAPLSTADVVFTIESLRDPDIAATSPAAEFWRGVEVEAIDDLRLRFRLQAPFAPFLAATTLPIVPRHLLEDVSPTEWETTTWSRRPIGAGPFRLHTINASEALLVPFTGAVRGRPTLDLLVLRFYPSAAAARAALRRNEIQGVAFEAARHPELADGSDTLQQFRLPLAEQTMLAMNLRVPPLNDPQLRTALAQGLDRATMVGGSQHETARLLQTPLLPQTPFHGPARLPTLGIAQATAALDDLGWRPDAEGTRARGGVPLRLALLCADSPDQVELARAIARQWQQIGVAVTIGSVSRERLQSRLQARDFVLALQSWALPTADPDLFALWHSSQAEHGVNYVGLDDEDIDRLLVDGRTTVDHEQRVAIYHEFEQRWIELVPAIPLSQSLLVYELAPNVRPAGLQAGHLLATPSHRFDMISEWTVDTP